MLAVVKIQKERRIAAGGDNSIGGGVLPDLVLPQ
jgi:hypothetical protein